MLMACSGSPTLPAQVRPLRERARGIAVLAFECGSTHQHPPQCSGAKHPYRWRSRTRFVDGRFCSGKQGHSSPAMPCSNPSRPFDGAGFDEKSRLGRKSGRRQDDPYETLARAAPPNPRLRQPRWRAGDGQPLAVVAKPRRRRVAAALVDFPNRQPNRLRAERGRADPADLTHLDQRVGSEESRAISARTSACWRKQESTCWCKSGIPLVP